VTSKYLTKSKFKLAIECPTKLYYTDKPIYSNRNIDNSFLESLANGGYQVGELAKKYFESGHDLSGLGSKDALLRSNELLLLDEVIIFEAAIQYHNLFVRVDILRKYKGNIDLIEVKAKSIDLNLGNPFITRKGLIQSGWLPYLYDVAFQKHVIASAFPLFTVASYLMLADKSAVSSTDGLNQKFRIDSSSNYKSIVITSPLSDRDLSAKLLIQINVDKYCDLIFEGKDSDDESLVSFVDRINTYADHYIEDIKITAPISSVCADCEFRADTEEGEDGKLSGFRECWSNELGWSDRDFEEPSVLDLWNFRKKDEFIKKGKIKLSQITQSDIDPIPGEYGLSTTERQWLQIEKSNQNGTSIWLDRDGLRDEMSKWIFPLHFIDFETAVMAIPFNKGQHPYESIAFQFSHHIVDESGHVVHQGEYLHREPGTFPNYDFLRELKRQLEQDSGTIFRYAAHENSILNAIYRQLKRDPADIEDRDELCLFIQSITKSIADSVDQWEGERNMVDMLELVKRYYYNPLTNGSNSIKHVLPATINSSGFLKSKYSNEIYGSSRGIKSHNFENKKWVEYDGDNVIDPYKLLPKMFQGRNELSGLLSDSNQLKEGGAAMMSYALMQHKEMDSYERGEISEALLKYCELDTMAMVMIYEAWKEWL